MAAIQDIKVSIEHRPCYVGERKALFHRWTVSESFVYQSKCFMKDFVQYRERVEKELRSDIPIIDNMTEPHKTVCTLGIVEYEDGTVEQVEPDRIRFVDTDGRMADIAWPKT